jgi:hypothetical protein
MTKSETFKRAVDGRRDATDTFFGEFGFDACRSSAMIESEMSLVARVRGHMRAGHGGGRLFRLDDEAAPFLERARRLLADGKVGAVDGTTALPKIDFMNTTQYACAVAWLTSQRRGEPHIIITETSSRYADPNRIRAASDNELEDICAELDEARDAESWTTTFREYEERRLAIEHCPAEAVLIDGPIFTQNLISQTEGRKLLSNLIASPKTYIGVIKNISASLAQCRWCASALNTGEGYLVYPVGEPIRRRAVTGGQTEIVGWLPSADEFCRLVFRPAEKAFAFECRMGDIGLACALFQLDASPTLGHELPLLLETVDSQLRSGFAADLARDMVLSRIMTQTNGYRSAIDAVDERDLR